MNIEQINSIAKDMKYEALYWAMGFDEKEPGIFKKEWHFPYGSTDVKVYATIDVESFMANFDITDAPSICIQLNTHKSFVTLECVNYLLDENFLPVIEEDGWITRTRKTNKYYSNGEPIVDKGHFLCYQWGQKIPVEISRRVHENGYDYVTYATEYTSRLVSGIIERKIGREYCISSVKEDTKENFVKKDTTLVKYTGDEKNVVVPEGITHLASCVFWDNQNIENVVLPDSLVSMGGDTFYNCKNLRSVNIPENVSEIGNNPFAGCPLVKVTNYSENFTMRDGALYTKDNSRIIYYPISGKDKSYSIKNGTKIIGKHAFFMCNNLEHITIPESVIKMENNPFSGCEKLFLENNSPRYKIIDGVIYDERLYSVIGCLNSTHSECLRLKNVKRICRNSFWNCKGIQKIILPPSLEQIGYNPFVGCSSIEFVSESENFIVENGILFSADKKTLICCPPENAVGEVFVPESVTTLERGAFSGCEKMTSIHLHNVSIISKTCFTNCNSLKEVYCSDIVSYIGEWAFAHCKNLESVSVYKDCFIERNVVLNSPAKIETRPERTNYVIESENLFTLSSLKNSYAEKIKSILIDPPYNSHIDYIGYKDSDFEGSYRNFIRERVEVCRTLLSDDGILVINIDEGGLSDIEAVCREIFGEKNVCTRLWKKKHPAFDINRVEKNPDKVQTDYEYIVFVKKNAETKYKKVMQPYFEDGELKEKCTSVPETFDCFGTNSSAKDEIKEIFGDRNYFSTPKPLKLMKELVRATTEKDSIVLDFFAGSGTVGHAVTDLNHEDGGNRKFILVSNSESDICRNVTMKRMKKCSADFVALP